MLALTGTGTDQTFTTTFAADTLTIATHGHADGDGPFILTNSGGALPAGLSAAEHYFVSVVDANTLQLHLPLRESILNAVIGITDDGTGTHTMTKASDDVDGSEAGFHYNRQNRPEEIEAATDVDDI